MSALSSPRRPSAARSTPKLPDGRVAASRQTRVPRVGRRLATMGLLVALGLALLAEVPGLRGVLREIGHIGPGWIAVAVALELA